MKELEEASNKAMQLLGDWVQWEHEGIPPALTPFQKSVYALTSLLTKAHCSMCLNINGCCFPRYNMPKYPLHPRCHCQLIPIEEINAVVKCDRNKIEKYLFVANKNGKKELFENWGYDIIDVDFIISELVEQGKQKYEAGDFHLGTLDMFGQRINIEITLPLKKGIGSVTFKSGWMVYPYGEIRLVTPFGGWIK